VKRAIAPATRGLRTATRHNRKYAAGTILALIALAASSGTSAGGCLELRGHSRAVGRVPTGEWARRVIQTCDADGALRPAGVCGGAATSRRKSWWPWT